MNTNTNAQESLPDYCFIYNEKAASFKKARKKWKHRLTDSFCFPVQDVSEDWLKEQSFKGLIVLGGDGTIHSVANAILRSGHAIPIGIIPGGGGNDFFKRLISRGHEHNGPDGFANYDVLEVEYPENDRKLYAVNTLEWGIGSIVAARRENNEGRFLIGMAKYFYLVIKSLFTFNSWKATVRLDGDDMEFEELSSIVVGFGSSTMGGGYIMFPDERCGPDKDKPFVLIAEGFSRFKALGLILKFVRADQYKDPHVHYYPFNTLELIPRGKESIMLTIDGELGPAPPVAIKLGNKRLKTFCVVLDKISIPTEI